MVQMDVIFELNYKDCLSVVLVENPTWVNSKPFISLLLPFDDGVPILLDDCLSVKIAVRFELAVENHVTNCSSTNSTTFFLMSKI